LVERAHEFLISGRGKLPEIGSVNRDHVGPQDGDAILLEIVRNRATRWAASSSDHCDMTFHGLRSTFDAGIAGRV
jgi:hypothetical protein